MDYTFLGKIWRRMPSSARWRIIRISQPTFTVSAGAIVLDRQDRVLLLHHILRPGSGWGIPGGFLDHGEQADQAVRREIREETGMELDDLRFIQMHTTGRHIEMVFMARSTGVPRVLSREITEAGWFDMGSIPDGLPSQQRILIEKVIAKEVW